MFNKRFVLCIALLFCVVTALVSDIPSPADRCQLFNHVTGFKDYPDVAFYSGSVWLMMDFTFKKVETDSLTFFRESWQDTPFVSWNPIFSKLVPGKGYDRNEEPFFRPKPASTTDSTSFRTELLTDETRFVEFDRIDRYYRVSQTNLHPANSEADFKVVLEKTVYQCGDYQIFADGDFQMIPNYLSTVKSAKFNLSKLLKYVKSLKHHTVARINTDSGTKPSIPLPNSIINSVTRSLNVNINRYVVLYIIALVLSILIEFMVLLLLFKQLTKKTITENQPFLWLLFACAIGTALTLTINWWILPLLIQGYGIRLFTQEVFALVVEAFIYAWLLKISLKKGVFLSAACNLTSYAIGIVLITYLL